MAGIPRTAARVEIVYVTSEVFWGFQSALYKRLIDDDLGRDVGEFSPLPGLHLLPHRLEVSLHSINADRDAVDERKRLRVFRQHGSEHAANGQDDG